MNDRQNSFFYLMTLQPTTQPSISGPWAWTSLSQNNLICAGCRSESSPSSSLRSESLASQKPKDRFRVISPPNGVEGIQVTDCVIVPLYLLNSSFSSSLLKTHYLTCVEVGRCSVIQISRQYNSPTRNRLHLEKWIERMTCEEMRLGDSYEQRPQFHVHHIWPRCKSYGLLGRA